MGKCQQTKETAALIAEQHRLAPRNQINAEQRRWYDAVFCNNFMSARLSREARPNRSLNGHGTVSNGDKLIALIVMWRTLASVARGFIDGSARPMYRMNESAFVALCARWRVNVKCKAVEKDFGSIDCRTLSFSFSRSLFLSLSLPPPLALSLSFKYLQF